MPSMGLFNNVLFRCDEPWGYARERARAERRRHPWFAPLMGGVTGLFVCLNAALHAAINPPARHLQWSDWLGIWAGGSLAMAALFSAVLFIPQPRRIYLHKKGLRIANRLQPYESIRSFCLYPVGADAELTVIFYDGRQRKWGIAAKDRPELHAQLIARGLLEISAAQIPDSTLAPKAKIWPLLIAVLWMFSLPFLLVAGLKPLLNSVIQNSSEFALARGRELESIRKNLHAAEISNRDARDFTRQLEQASAPAEWKLALVILYGPLYGALLLWGAIAVLIVNWPKRSTAAPANNHKLLCLQFSLGTTILLISAAAALAAFERTWENETRAKTLAAIDAVQTRMPASVSLRNWITLANDHSVYHNARTLVAANSLIWISATLLFLAGVKFMPDPPACTR